MVFGAVDTAFDCATSDLECVTWKIFLVLRKASADKQAVPEELESSDQIEDVFFYIQCL